MKALPAVRRRVVVSLIACAGLLTAGCAAGQHARTAAEVPAVDGSHATIGHLQVLEVALAKPANNVSYPIGASASLQLVAVNVGQTDDQLTGITSDAASSVTIADQTTGASASPSPSAAPTSTAPAPLTPITIAAGSRVSFGINTGDKLVVLVGLNKQLWGGNSIHVTFTFAKAGSVTLTVPVQITDTTAGLTVGGSAPSE